MTIDFKTIIDAIESNDSSLASKIMREMIDQKTMIEMEEVKNKISAAELADEVDPIDVEDEDIIPDDQDWGWYGEDEDGVDDDELELGDPYSVLEGRGKKRRIVTRISSTGKRRRRVMCPKGYKLSSNGTSCMKISGGEAQKYRVAKRKELRSKAAKGSGAANRAVRKRGKAMRRRSAMGL